MSAETNSAATKLPAQISCSLGTHGSSQIELKVRYPFGSTRRSRFRTELFFEIPQQISISLDEQGRRELLDDTICYSRFSAANMPLPWLWDKDHTEGPLGRIWKILQSSNKRSPEQQQRLLYEMRTFANLFTIQLKSLVKILQQILKNPESREGGLKTGMGMIQDVEQALEAYRGLGAACSEPAVVPKIAQAYSLADEYLGDQCVRYLLGLKILLSREGYAKELGRRLEDFLQRELKRQSKRGYTAVRWEQAATHDPQTLERFILRESRLKKWVQQVLYLGVAQSRVPGQVGHMLASVAAALAMSIAVLAAFYADRMFASYSLPWALLIVGSYIIKDRIKEVMRAALIRFVPMAVSDRSRVLRDPATGKTAGRSRLSIRKVDAEQVPRPPGRERDDQILTNIVPRNGLLFASALRLNGKQLLKNHKRTNGVIDITRIRIDKWLRDLDAPTKGIRLMLDDTAVTVSGNRTYQIFAALRLSSDNQTAPLLRHWVIVLDRNGIKRIEKLK